MLLNVTESEVLNVFTNHLFLSLVGGIFDCLLERSNDILHKIGEVLGTHTDLLALELVFPEVRKILLLEAADLQVEISFAVFKEAGIEW